ncbi:putative ulp1 protease protein [Botrytis fragariae]|uniref:Putative ulp1 protease protein n=1 Tax=Botrytis fragariae TaxID=1964551 RepID=A0A8H6AZA6_9HELO|nr:putative ulp1 protease protein [Botrytis fragariae]KAF5876252.1 putative ulp1 protease protein [Botrytis fragariae]
MTTKLFWRTTCPRNPRENQQIGSERRLSNMGSILRPLMWRKCQDGNGSRSSEESNNSTISTPNSDTDEIDGILQQYEGPLSKNKAINLVVMDSSESDDAEVTSKATTQKRALIITRTSLNYEDVQPLETNSKVFIANNNHHQTSQQRCIYERRSSEGAQIPLPRPLLIDAIESISSKSTVSKIHHPRMNLQHVSETDGHYEVRIDKGFRRKSIESKLVSDTSISHIDDSEEPETSLIFDARARLQNIHFQKVSNLANIEICNANNEKPIVQHINDLDGLDDHSPTTLVDDAPKEGDTDSSKIVQPDKWMFANRYWKNTSTRISPTAQSSKAYKETGAKMTRPALHGGKKPVNRLGNAQNTPSYSHTRSLEPFNLQSERPNKKQKTEQAPLSNGTGSGPNQFEHEANQGQGPVSQIPIQSQYNSSPHQENGIRSKVKSFEAYTVAEYQAVNDLVKPRKDKRKRHKVNSDHHSESQSHTHGNAGFKAQQTANAKRLTNGSHLEDIRDPISNEEDELQAPHSGSKTVPRVVIPSSGNAHLPVAHQAPRSRASGLHKSSYVSNSQLEKRNPSNSVQTRRVLGELQLEDGSEDELSQGNPPEVSHVKRANKSRQNPEVNYNDGEDDIDKQSSLDRRGDMTRWGSGRSNDQKLQQRDHRRSFRVESLFSPSFYWHRPGKMQKQCVDLDKSGILGLMGDDKKIITGFSINANAILKMTVGLDSCKLIIRKSQGIGPMKDPDMLIEFSGILEIENFLKSIKPFLKDAEIKWVESSEIDQRFHHTREKLDKRTDQAANKRSRAESQPEDVQLLTSNQDRRTAQRTQLLGHDDQQAQHYNLSRAKRQKIHEKMQTQPSQQNKNDNSDPIEPAEFYTPLSKINETRASLRSAERPKSYKPTSEARSPSPERWSEVNRDWEKNWKKSVVYPKSGKKTATVDKQDIYRLDNGEFLNDNLIMFYLLWLEQQHPELATRVYVHNTFFYASLTKAAKGKKGINYEAVERWTAKVDLLSYDYIIVPVNENTHWYVAIICNAPKLLNLEIKQSSQPTENGAQSEQDREMESRSASKLTTPSKSPQSTPVRSVNDKDETGVNNSFGELSLAHGEKTGASIDLEPAKSFPPSHHGLPTTSLEMDPDDTAADKSATNVIDLAQSSSPPTKSNSTTKGKRIPPIRTYDPKQPRIITFDSLALKHSNTCSNLKDYMVAEIKAKKSMSITPPKPIGMAAKTQDKDSATGRYLGKGLPVQGNYCDCGVYLLSYIEEFFERPDSFIEDIMENKYEVDGDRNDTPAFRTKIRNILLELQAEQVQEEYAAKMAKIAEKAKRGKDVPFMTANKTDLAKPQTASGPEPNIARQKSIANASTLNERRNHDDTSTEARNSLKSLSKAKEVINISDSQDNLQEQSQESPESISVNVIDDKPIEERPRSRVRDKEPRQTAHTVANTSKPPIHLEIRDSQEDQETTHEGADQQLLTQNPRRKPSIIDLEEDESHKGEEPTELESRSGTSLIGNAVDAICNLFGKSTGQAALQGEVSGLLPAHESRGDDYVQGLESPSRSGMNSPRQSESDVKLRQNGTVLRSPSPEQRGSKLAQRTGSEFNEDAVDLTGDDPMLLDESDDNFSKLQQFPPSPLVASSRKHDRSKIKTPDMAQFARRNTSSGNIDPSERFHDHVMERFVNNKSLSGRDSAEAKMIAQYKH